jgi:hypothetical protein
MGLHRWRYSRGAAALPDKLAGPVINTQQSTVRSCAVRFAAVVQTVWLAGIDWCHFASAVIGAAGGG